VTTSKTEIFVFGSNLKGRHGKGSALEAALYWGAKEGVAIGISGHSYAIPTKDAKLRILGPDTIRVFVNQFLEFAKSRPELKFNVVEIGCGNAGYKPSQIAPMFKGYPSNVNLPDSFLEVLYRGNGS